MGICSIGDDHSNNYMAEVTANVLAEYTTLRGHAAVIIMDSHTVRSLLLAI